jgi:type IV pilus assembly protein PilW
MIQDTGAGDNLVSLPINRSNNDIASTDGKSEYNTMKPHDAKNEKGFTLIELLVAMVIGSIALAGIYGAYRAQLKSHVTQNAVVDVQQNLRSALYFLQKSIRMAGYEHHDNKDAKARLELDFLDTDPERDFNEGGFDQPSGAASDGNRIAFTVDTDGDGVIEVDDTEIVAYRLSAGNELQIWKEVAPDAWEWIAIAENISRLEFVYLDEDDNTVNLSTGTALEKRAKADSVRSVGIILEAQVDQGNPMLDADKTSRTVSARVKCRNLGLPQ